MLGKGHVNKLLESVIYYSFIVVCTLKVMFTQKTLLMVIFNQTVCV